MCSPLKQESKHKGAGKIRFSPTIQNHYIKLK